MSKIFDIYKNHPSVYASYIDTSIEQRNFRSVIEKISRYSGVTDSINVLDMCCGPFTIKPYLIELMDKYFPTLQFLEYTGVDINKQFIKYAQKHSLHHRLKANFMKADASEVKISHQYGTIIATSAFHHITDSRKGLFIDNVVRHLTNDGVFIVYEKFIGKHSSAEEAISSGMRFYSERIIDILAEQDLSSDQAFGLANEMYLTAVRNQEYKVTHEEFIDVVSARKLKIVEEQKLWPNGDRFRESTIGDFVIVLQK